MKDVRYLTFEVNATCNLTALHPRCPINDPERFKFGQTDRAIDDDLILRFWRWCREEHGFRGIVLWHLYNEPTLVLGRITALLTAMRAIAPDQPSHLWTNSSPRHGGFDHVQHTNYKVVRPDELDHRRASTTGEGDYARVPPRGACGRGYGWEVIIDHFGNWVLCCNDWRCEESPGNLHRDPWPELFARYVATASRLAWEDLDSWRALPRLCRACVTENPNLHRTALPPPGVTW